MGPDGSGRPLERLADFPGPRQVSGDCMTLPWEHLFLVAGSPGKAGIEPEPRLPERLNLPPDQGECLSLSPVASAPVFRMRRPLGS